MDPGTALSVADLCYRAGKVVIQAIHDWKDADKEITERVTIIENCWTQTRLQVEFISGIAHTLDVEHERVLEETLMTLVSKLSLVSSKLERLTDKDSSKRTGFLALGSRPRRGRFALRKDVLDAAIKDMEEWQKRFDPTWFLLMKKDTAVIDEELRRSQFRKSAIDRSSNTFTLLTVANGVRDAQQTQSRQSVPIFLPFENLQIVDLPFSNAKPGRRQKNTSKWFVIDTLACVPGKSLDGVTRDVTKLASKLARADPLTFGLLTCRGVMRVLDPIRKSVLAFDFIFRMPDGMEALECLRYRLLGSKPSLTRRVAIAKDLARSVSYVHTLSFVHKNIRPESVLLFEASESRNVTFLVGFNSFRDGGGVTGLIGDSAWDTNLYRHPSRQGDFPEQRYSMQHDIYSLGVCLLEVGLWKSLLTYTDDVPPQPQYTELESALAQWLNHPNSDDLPEETVESAKRSSMMLRTKDYFIHLARESLPARMGDWYTEIVVSCLCCLDDGDENFGDIADDEFSSDGVLMGVRFIQQILLGLEEIAT